MTDSIVVRGDCDCWARRCETAVVVDFQRKGVGG